MEENRQKRNGGSSSDVQQPSEPTKIVADANQQNVSKDESSTQPTSETKEQHLLSAIVLNDINQKLQRQVFLPKPPAP
uniref:Uncharacterized protein n=1 Tax=Ciona intestinalis TaxID=7719 RepID=F6UUH7_CIOIN